MSTDPGSTTPLASDAVDTDEAIESVDVLVVGAGISGIDMAYRIQTMCPGVSYAVLEARESMGGTWDLFRYPGIRSDSDMYTLGFPFEPWTGEQSISDGASILAYVRDTAAKYGIDAHIRYSHRVVEASWSGRDARWTVTVETPEGRRRLAASWIHTATGYYSYDAPHRADIPGLEDFAGDVAHPQFWPEDLQVGGRRVVVIGSGATAVTLVPALVEQGAAVVTMLQRSPSYLLALPSRDELARRLADRMGIERAYDLIRWKNILTALGLYQASRRTPRAVGRLLTSGAVRATSGSGLGPEHFAPHYDPWDQRMCFVPDGDLFAALRSGRATIVTDTIERVLPEGVRTSSGALLEADVVVTATGLAMQLFGGAALVVDGQPVNLPDRHLYRGLMIEGVPNLTTSVGYANASWTLRADLAARYACRLIAHVRSRGHASARPRPSGPMARRPVLPLTSGYVRRALADLPSQGDRDPWMIRQNYVLDRRALRRADVTRDMVFDAVGGS
ncbi:putative monooxygenase [Nostocoides japonicum T1-X7]|uniref:Putative monooxygenase n=1 Tax=Nostocoides japonicum T1-X7 TaxID=1194083 RepID=A0A077M8U4_9MICO|nr:putative monooxygenase [Tetrasphaera japonica T1-X7]